jgi:hypothetical protein
MADYIKISDYAAKDTLLTGDPAKLVKGSEIGADFDAVAVAVATKLDATGGTVNLSTTTLTGTAAQFDTACSDTNFLFSASVGTSVQAYSANLDEYAAVNPTTAGLALLDDATSGDQLTTLGGTTVGKAVFVAASVAAAQQAMDVEVGVDVQAYDADTAKTDVAQTFTASQRGTVTTDNDASFDQSVSNNFFCTPSAGAELTFTNHTAGQSGLILFVNSSNYAITAAASTWINSSDLSKLSATGTYLISYMSNGTNTYCVVSASLKSAGAA